MGNAHLAVRIPLELRKRLWTQLALENNMAEEFWIGRHLTFTDLVRELLERGLTDRLREIKAKAEAGSTLTAKPFGQ